MQLKKPIGGPLAAATCSLLGTLPTAPAAAQEADNWDIDTSLLIYNESDGRVQDLSLNLRARK